MVYTAMRKRESRQLIETLCSSYPRVCESLGLEPGQTVYEVASEGSVVYVVDGVPVAFKHEEALVPTLVSARMSGLGALHYALVDEGAVKPILNGADVMAPGIVDVSDFGAGDIVVVWSSDRRTPLAVSRALMGSAEVRSKRRGRALKNLHHAGDEVWRISLEVLRRFGGSTPT